MKILIILLAFLISYSLPLILFSPYDLVDVHTQISSSLVILYHTLPIFFSPNTYILRNITNMNNMTRD